MSFRLFLPSKRGGGPPEAVEGAAPTLAERPSMGCPFNPAQSFVDVLQHQLVGYPENPNALPSDPLIPPGVMILGALILVHAAVEFDCQPRSHAEEVHDVWPQRVLTAELQPAELLAAKGAPELRLCPGQMTAEVSRLRQG